MHSFNLREFLEPVPVFTATEPLGALLRLFAQTGCERAIALDLQQQPQGGLNLRTLVAYLLAHPDLNVPSLTLSDLLAGADTLLVPLSTLSIDCSLEQVQATLRNSAPKWWICLDPSSRCLGILDELKLWNLMAPPQQAIAYPDSPAQRGDFSQLPTSSGSLSPLDALVQMLEALPLPLMLQSGQGQAIAQNLAWREQLASLHNPITTAAEIALLETIPPSSSLSCEANKRSFDSSPIAAKLPHLPLFDPEVCLGWDGTSFPPMTPEGFNACRLGPEPNSCICSYPAQDGQERIWQFTRLPIPETLFKLSEHADLSQPLPLSTFQVALLRQFSQLFAQVQASSPSSTTETESLWLVLAQDTTEQQQVAKELAAKNADLLQLNRLKDEFLACISHELKTPLTAVLGLSSLLKDQLVGSLNDRQRRYTHLIHESGRHLMMIVNDILDLTRIETGQLELNMEPLQIEAACLRAYEQARQLQVVEGLPETGSQDIAKAAAQFRLEIQPDLESIMADDLRLRQMLTNLLSNALKFTPAESEIGLQVETWDGWIAFTVWDTGIGIPPDKQHLIFQKFQQLENPLTRRFEGTGLGLVLTQRLARLHGGDITFTSSEGKGSRFTLLLPPRPLFNLQPKGEVEEDLAGEWLAKLPRATLSRRLVLVVEAVPRFLDDLVDQLLHLNCRVAIARSGPEALEKIRCLQPTTVFMNPILPLLSGWDVLTLLKASAEIREIPVVITATRAEKPKALSRGASGFLSLPIQPDALQRYLNELFAPSPPAPASLPVNLTILHLRFSETNTSQPHPAAKVLPDLASLLHPYRCRVLEVDDLDQADLLVRVWKPHLILLDGDISNPPAYLTHLSQYACLAALPLVTLTPELTQAANQIRNLSVFPCLAPLTPSADSSKPDVSALLQVMQVAAGAS